ncbi:MAG: T9SS type A sorting domain-containing protein, partial [Muribaculaceae bacterium]|nr:T9SS type A sorting domain-containing protein [Muribaculaceae bacterium]
FPTASPICPINSLMTHGLIVSKYGPPSEMPRNDSDATAKGIIREMHCAFGCGSGLIELYVDNDLMSTIGNDGELWEALAECIKWHRENEDVLADVHWVGGNPWDGSKANVYGWASWNGQKATLTLRNPNSTSKTFTTTLRQALDIPSYVTGKITLTNAFKNQTQYSGITGESIDIDQTISFNMPAFDVVVLNGNCAQPLEISGSMTISNVNKRAANIKTVYSNGYNISKGWMQIGVLNGWNGKTNLTYEDIANMFAPVATANGNSIITWSGAGKLSETLVEWENFATQTGTPVVVILGDGNDIKDAEEIAIFKLRANGAELLWENADGVTVNIGQDNIVPVYGEIADIDDVKYIKTAPFTYPLGVEEQEVDNCKVYVSGNEIIINGAVENATIKVFDFMGRAINETIASGNETKVNIPEKGFYLVSVFENNKLVKTEKVIVK